MTLMVAGQGVEVVCQSSTMQCPSGWLLKHLKYPFTNMLGPQAMGC